MFNFLEVFFLLKGFFSLPTVAMWLLVQGYVIFEIFSICRVLPYNIKLLESTAVVIWVV